MKSPFFTGAAALALIAIPAAAQDMDGMDQDSMATTDSTMADDSSPYEMTAQQSGMYDGWPADRRTAYDGWPYDVQEYYWTLEPNQTEGWWMLNDEQRTRIYAMTPEQRTMAWQQISTQMNAMQNSQGNSATSGSNNANMTNPGNSAMSGSNNASMTGNTARTTAASANSMQPRFVRSEVVQTTPGDQGPPTGDLPICEDNAQDNCINAWEAGERGPGVTRPLDYWPGQPASQSDD